MTVTHDVTINRSWSQFRIYTRPTKQDAWAERFAAGPFGEIYTVRPGLFVEIVNRVALPAMGHAVLTQPFGLLNGRIYSMDELPDIVMQEIRIDAKQDEDDYTTIFWGIVEDQTDEITTPAATTASGVRTYKAFDLLASTLRRRNCVRHHYKDTLDYLRVGGAVSFNMDHTSNVGRPNRSGSFVTGSIYGHVLPQSTASYWTAIQAAQNLIDCNSEETDHIFTVEDIHGTADPAPRFTVAHGEELFGCIARLLDRKKGRGIAFFNWTNTANGPTTPRITIKSALSEAIVQSVAGYPEEVIVAAGDTITLDLEGDRRIQSLQMSGNNDLNVDYLETQGDNIEVLATYAYIDSSIQERWGSSDETAFDALTSDDIARQGKYASVYRTHGPLIGAPLRAGDGNGGPTKSISIYCNDGGDIQYRDDAGFTSDYSYTIMHDLPCPIYLELHNGVPNGAQQKGLNDRHMPLVFFRQGDDSYVDGKASYQTHQFRVSERAIEYADYSEGTARAMADIYDTLVFTIGIKLSERVRVAYGDPKGRRRKTVTVPGIRLWIAHEDALVGLTTDGAGQRVTVSDTWRYYADDRSQLRYLHSLMVAWYMRPNGRRAIEYSVKANGLCANWTSGEDNETITAWPTLGQIPTTVQAAGQALEIATPITQIYYNNRTGTTTFRTDWSELEL